MNSVTLALSPNSSQSQAMDIPYRCPLCSSRLELKERSFLCVNNHCFDQAKEGYVNLLPVQNKNSKNPGDSLEMIQARTQFLMKGYYEKFCDTLENALRTHSKKNSSDLHALLDIGCGNGWYSERLKQRLSIRDIHGIDISKHAIKTAAKGYKKNTYAVASAFSLPYEDASFDSALCVFSPLKLSEVLRVLKPGGVLVFAGPGPSHLRELASLIYDEVREHSGNPLDFNEQHNLEKIEKLHYGELCRIAHQDNSSLLAMTPYYWSATEKQKQRITEAENLTVHLDFDVTVAVKRQLT